MEKKPLNIILLGDPASGKGTQAAKLVKKYGLYNLDMGNEIRKPAVRATYDYSRTSAVGGLIPTRIVRSILRRVIRQTPFRQGILFNGNPKMINEAKLVRKLLERYKRTKPLVIYLNVPMKETLLRAKKRRVHAGGSLVKRDDDTKKAIRKRKRYYKKQISRVVKFFRKEYGVGNRMEVWKRIRAAVQNYHAS